MNKLKTLLLVPFWLLFLSLSVSKVYAATAGGAIKVCGSWVCSTNNGGQCSVPSGGRIVGFACGSGDDVGTDTCNDHFSTVSSLGGPAVMGYMCSGSRNGGTCISGTATVRGWTWPPVGPGSDKQNDWACKVQLDVFDSSGSFRDCVVWRDPERCCTPSAYWTGWSNAGGCGSYVACRQRKSRTCVASCGGLCDGWATNGTVQNDDSTACGTVNGGWSDWDPASCPSCGTNVVQTRTCTNPAPACGGASCSGASSQPCNIPLCLGTVTGLVWNDINKNSVYDALASGPISSITVTYTYNTGVPGAGGTWVQACNAFRTKFLSDTGCVSACASLDSKVNCSFIPDCSSQTTSNVMCTLGAGPLPSRYWVCFPNPVYPYNPTRTFSYNSCVAETSISPDAVSVSPSGSCGVLSPLPIAPAATYNCSNVPAGSASVRVTKAGYDFSTPSAAGPTASKTVTIPSSGGSVTADFGLYSCSPVNGGWSSSVVGDWINAGGCSGYYLCQQKQTRSTIRTCTNPAPSCGGAYCSGCSGSACPATDTVVETRYVGCAMPAFWTNWDSCPMTCGGTTTRFCITYSCTTDQCLRGDGTYTTPDNNRETKACDNVCSYALAVTKDGTGTGTVTSSPSGISCGSTCSASFGYGTSVTLAATAATGSTFAGWSGDVPSSCSTAPSPTTCTVAMTQARNVTATFTLNSYTLTVTKPVTNTGTGTVTSTSNPTQATQINCGATCSVSYTYNTSVVLTATPTTGSTFTGWSGDVPSVCSTAPYPATCTVTMNQARNVTATFNISCIPPTAPVVSESHGGCTNGNPSWIWTIPAGSIDHFEGLLDDVTPINLISQPYQPTLAEGLHNLQVRACAACACGPYSAASPVTVDKTKPTRPVPTTAGACLPADAFTVTWSAPTDPAPSCGTTQQYHVQLALDSSFTSPFLDSLVSLAPVAGTVTYTVNLLPYLTATPQTVYFRVHTTDAAGNDSDWSTVLTQEVEKDTIVNVPSLTDITPPPLSPLTNSFKVTADIFPSGNGSACSASTSFCQNWSIDSTDPCPDTCSAPPYSPPAIPFSASTLFTGVQLHLGDMLTVCTTATDLNTGRSQKTTNSYGPISSPSWFTVFNGDVYGRSISEVVAASPGGSYEAWMISNDSSGDRPGGLAMAQNAISVNDTAGAPYKASERSDTGNRWQIPSYGVIPWPVVFDGLSGSSGQLLYYPGDLTIDSDNAEDFEGKVVYAEGTITLGGSLKSGPGTPTNRHYDLEAVLIAGENIVVSDTTGKDNNGNDMIKIRGALYAQNGVSLLRSLGNNDFPAVLVTYDPSVFFADLHQLSVPQYTWREIMP